MATTTVLVAKLIGQAWVRNADGSLTALREGMRIAADADVVTASGSSVQLQADGLPPLTIGESQDVVLTQDLFTRAEPREAAVTPPSSSAADALIAAINRGQDPFDNLDPTAATLTGGSGGGGGTFVRLSSILEVTSPLDLAYPGIGHAVVEPRILGTAAVSPEATAGSASGTVYEHGLIADSAATPRTTSGMVTVSATDGIARVTLGGHVYTLAELKGASDASPLTFTTADGSTVNITGYHSADGDKTATITYSYTLNTAQTDSLPGNDSVSETIAVAVDGTNGSHAEGHITVTIVDDVPAVTVGGADTVVEGAAAITGSWSLAPGADGVTPAHFTISIDGGAAQQVQYGQGIDTGKGILTINAD
jgi:hypothetical protein